MEPTLEEQIYIADVRTRSDAAKHDWPEAWAIGPEDIDKLIAIIYRLLVSEKDIPQG